MHPFHRTELLVGGPGFASLQQARFCVIGLGGVGSYAAEALARSGVGHLTLMDFDTVCLTNLNRQLHATRQTVGQSKSALMAERVRAINPKADVVAIEAFYSKKNADDVLGAGFDYVLDCIDNMTAKVHLLTTCYRRKQAVMASMGAGGRLDPTRIRVTDISKTQYDPFARIARDLLREEGITTGIECVWTEEPPNNLDAEAKAAFRCICPNKDDNDVHSCEDRYQVQGSVSWMPAIFGLTLAGAVVNRYLKRPIWSADHRSFTRQEPAEKLPIHRKIELLKSAGFSE